MSVEASSPGQVQLSAGPRGPAGLRCDRQTNPQTEAADVRLQVYISAHVRGSARPPRTRAFAVRYVWVTLPDISVECVHLSKVVERTRSGSKHCGVITTLTAHSSLQVPLTSVEMCT